MLDRAGTIDSTSLPVDHPAMNVPPSRGLLPAPLHKRLLALVYDSLLLIAVLFLAMAVLLIITGGQRFEAGSPWLSLYLLGVSYAFFGWFWTHGGQTLGMQAWRLKLVQGNDQPVTWWHAGARVLTAIPAWLVVIVGSALSANIALQSHAWLQQLQQLPRGIVLLLGCIWLVFDHWPGGWREKLTGTRVVQYQSTTDG
ncbi:MAG: RDD family protein [Proteobacteria bacterium]|nr:RDD family protein [Pseudomonadota bacterium]